MSEEEKKGPRCVFAGVQVPFKMEAFDSVHVRNEILERAVNFVDKHESKSLDQSFSGSVLHPKIGPPADDSFWKWMKSVQGEERMRQAVDEALGCEGPITITEHLEKAGIVKEYLGGHCKLIERCGDKLSVQTAFQTVRTWLVSKRSKGWVCLDDEYVVEL